MDYSALTSTDLLGLAVWREARGEGPIGRRGVAHVIVNRVSEPSWWGHDIPSVVLCKYQFSSFNPGDPNETKFPDPEDPEYQDIAAMCLGVIGGTDSDVTSGAQWYIDTSISPPSWTEALDVSLRVGRLTFYRKRRFVVTDPEIGT